MNGRDKSLPTLATWLDNPTLPDIELSGISEHTGELLADFAFIGVAANDEHLLQHCRAAVAAGATAILVDHPHTALAGNIAVPLVQVADLAERRGELAARFYDDPSAQLACVGVTGTNGKTSVAYHIADLSNRLGTPMGYCGTLGWGDLQSLRDGAMTTPNAVALQRQLAVMRDAALQGVAVEVSSHALDQGRADAVHFDYAVFTNLSRDHLDYHANLAAYADAKRRLFTEFSLQAAIINVDDEFGRGLAIEVEKELAGPVITYGKGGDWSWHCETTAAGSQVQWQTPSGVFAQTLSVVADYAIANITAAMATLVAMGHPVAQVIEQAPELLAVPGRMQVIAGGPDQPRIVVDYAHTPDALAKVLAALRPFCAGQLICVIGCGGDRDAGKRPQMAALAGTAADILWLTADNPRNEDPAAIIADMRAGLPTAAASGAVQVHEDVDRAAAINAAVAAAGAADLVLVAGKGHEDYQEIKGQRVPFDDVLVVQEALQRRATAGKVQEEQA